MGSVNDALSKWIEKWKKAAEWDPEDGLSVEFNADYWDDEEDNHPPHALRRSAKNRIIKEAIENGRVFDLDSIYKDGKLFGHQLRFIEGKGIFGNNIVRKYIIYNYEGKEYEVKYQFDFETRLIDFRIQEWCEKICDYVCIAQKIPFQLLCYGRLKIPANEIFDDIVGKMIMEINKKIEEYD